MKMATFVISLPLLLCVLAISLPYRVASFAFHQPPIQTKNILSQLPTHRLRSTKQILKGATLDTENVENPSLVDISDHDYEYDLAIIGAGPVGVQAAIVAATTEKKRVVLIDAPRASGQLMNEAINEDLSIGGPTGLFSKALRDAAKRIKVPTLRGMNLREDSIWNEIQSMCVDTATFNARDIKRQLEYAGVTLIEGFAKFDDAGGSHRLIVSHDEGTSAQERSNYLQTPSQATVITTLNVLIATGSRPFQPPNIPFDGVRVFDSDSINGLNFLPKSVVITGSGIVAIEFAKIFSSLGCEDVTLLIRDNSPKNALMKIGLDKDIAACLVYDLISSGINIQRGCEAGTIEVPSSSENDNNYVMPLKIGLKARGGQCDRSENCVQELKADIYIAAVGRKANTERLNLKAAGVEVDEYGGIVVDSNLRAKGVADGNVYGAGDVLGRPFLASTGVAQGVATIKNMFPSVSSLEDGISEDSLKDMDSPSAGEENAPQDICNVRYVDGEVLGVEDELLSMAGACDPTSLVANPVSAHLLGYSCFRIPVDRQCLRVISCI